MGNIKLFEEKKYVLFIMNRKKNGIFAIVDIVELLSNSLNPTDYLKNSENEILSLAAI